MTASLVEHPVVMVTYFGANMHKGASSPAYRKLETIAAGFEQHAAQGGASGGSGVEAPWRYRLVLLYQRTSPNREREPFNCTRHVPANVGCAEYTRGDTKRAFGHELALHRRGDAPRRLNIGFWICALWMMDREREGLARRPLWYVEDDVFLPGSWARFLSRYDGLQSSVDLLVPQDPYIISKLLRGRKEDRLPTRGWRRLTLNASRGSTHSLAGAELELAIARGAETGTVPTQLSIPPSTLAERLPVQRDADYAKVPLYVWRMSGRLSSAVSRALLRGARAHEEILVPTVCRAALSQPRCEWRSFEEEDLGIPCGTNDQDAWYRLQQVPSMRERARGLDLAGFRHLFTKLQDYGSNAAAALPVEPQRIYHPIKGQLLQTQNSLTLREAGGV